eukprot:TRINITY_DN45122_c0_g1_i2.p1 TRINITY_DN45122_c0_g1~~TRINITY_DN45122_c0_g1_i2.p1  ORF type:complete len:782 (-),score=188.85 TRINITY_DN45122_c0_g1_i2:29-2374(-)
MSRRACCQWKPCCLLCAQPVLWIALLQPICTLASGLHGVRWKHVDGDYSLAFDEAMPASPSAIVRREDAWKSRAEMRRLRDIGRSLLAYIHGSAPSGQGSAAAVPPSASAPVLPSLPNASSPPLQHAGPPAAIMTAAAVAASMAAPPTPLAPGSPLTVAPAASAASSQAAASGSSGDVQLASVDSWSSQQQPPPQQHLQVLPQQQVPVQQVQQQQQLLQPQPQQQLPPQQSQPQVGGQPLQRQDLGPGVSTPTAVAVSVPSVVPVSAVGHLQPPQQLAAYRPLDSASASAPMPAAGVATVAVGPAGSVSVLDAEPRGLISAGATALPGGPMAGTGAHQPVVGKAPLVSPARGALTGASSAGTADPGQSLSKFAAFSREPVDTPPELPGAAAGVANDSHAAAAAVAPAVSATGRADAAVAAVPAVSPAADAVGRGSSPLANMSLGPAAMPPSIVNSSTGTAAAPAPPTAQQTAGLAAPAAAATLRGPKITPLLHPRTGATIQGVRLQTIGQQPHAVSTAPDASTAKQAAGSSTASGAALPKPGGAAASREPAQPTVKHIMGARRKTQLPPAHISGLPPKFTRMSLAKHHRTTDGPFQMVKSFMERLGTEIDKDAKQSGLPVALMLGDRPYLLRPDKEAAVMTPIELQEQLKGAAKAPRAVAEAMKAKKGIELLIWVPDAASALALAKCDGLHCLFGLIDAGKVRGFVDAEEQTAGSLVLLEPDRMSRLTSSTEWLRGAIQKVMPLLPASLIEDSGDEDTEAAEMDSGGYDGGTIDLVDNPGW